MHNRDQEWSARCIAPLAVRLTPPYCCGMRQRDSGSPARISPRLFSSMQVERTALPSIGPRRGRKPAGARRWSTRARRTAAP